jgi:arginyl-tRNA synthetase
MESVYMKNILKLVGQVASQTIKLRFDVEEPAFVQSEVKKANFDYQIPTAMKLFNNYKTSHNSFGFKNAKEIGLELKAALPDNEVVKELDVNDQGFVFAVIKDDFIEREINSLLGAGIKLQPDRVRTCAVDFSSPNIAKEMHVGHLRSTIIGESISRILEYYGHTVHRINHLGDWGTQFGMLICHMKEVFPDYLEKLPPLSDLTTFYKEAKKKFDENPEFQKIARLTVVDLQQGNEDCLKAWKVLCDVSRVEFNKIYNRLDIKVFEYGESFYNKFLLDLCKDLEEKKFAVEDKGALCMFIPDKQIPLMVRKSDGGFNYDTTDLAAARYRLKELNADRLIYITDVGQFPHFDLIFEASKILGWHQPPQTSMEHMGFGLVTDSSGGKFKTRSGDTVKLVDLLDEAQKRAADQLKKRLGDNKDGSQTYLSEHEIDESAEKIGMAAVKYFDLKQNRGSNYKFDYDKMLDPKGNTAVYLLYSYARISSIISKSGLKEEDFQALLQKGGFKITHPHERLLAMTILRFPEVMDTVVSELAIHKLCDFIYDVAVKIAEGYNKYRIIDDPNKETRVLLLEGVRRILQLSFWMVGIKPLDKI